MRDFIKRNNVQITAFNLVVAVVCAVMLVIVLSNQKGSDINQGLILSKQDETLINTQVNNKTMIDVEHRLRAKLDSLNNLK